MSTAIPTSEQSTIHIKGVTGIILAGGKSSRYGKNKALEQFHGKRLIERVVDVMGAVFDRLIIMSNDPHEYLYLHLPIYPDYIEGLGPLGGIATGLDTIHDAKGFFVACDMPFLREDLIRFIVGLEGDYDAVVPKIDWKIEALHSLYSKRCLPAIRDMINAGEYQPIKLFDRVRVRFINEQEIAPFDPELRSFFNINRPHDLHMAQTVKKSERKDTANTHSP